MKDAENLRVGSPEAKIGTGKAASLTRRDWLLKLGEAAVLVGFSGTVEETVATPAAALVPPAVGSSALPPGLYEPSNDHLTHALSADRLFHPIPEGSETDYAKPLTGPFQPQFFSPSEFEVIKRITELMLGEPAELPSASSKVADDHENVSLVVAQWVDLVASRSVAVRDSERDLAPDHRTLAAAFYRGGGERRHEAVDIQTTCREGLHWLEEESQRRHQASFLNLNNDQQIEMLTSISDRRPDNSTQNPGTRFFSVIKAEVICGFYTSRTGLKELDYKGNDFYGECPGCSH